MDLVVVLEKSDVKGHLRTLQDGRQVYVRPYAGRRKELSRVAVSHGLEPGDRLKDQAGYWLGTVSHVDENHVHLQSDGSGIVRPHPIEHVAGQLHSDNLSVVRGANALPYQHLALDGKRKKEISDKARAHLSSKGTWPAAVEHKGATYHAESTEPFVHWTKTGKPPVYRQRPSGPALPED